MTRIFLGSSLHAVFITGVFVTLQENCTCKVESGHSHRRSLQLPQLFSRAPPTAVLLAAALAGLHPGAATWRRIN
eukprot:5588761-Prymnesium_polylepis.1